MCYARSPSQCAASPLRGLSCHWSGSLAPQSPSQDAAAAYAAAAYAAYAAAAYAAAAYAAAAYAAAYAAVSLRVSYSTNPTAHTTTTLY